MLLRSKADPSILAVMATGANTAIKIKASDNPYPGEHPAGTDFNFCQQRSWKHWEVVDDEESIQIYLRFLCSCPRADLPQYWS